MCTSRKTTCGAGAGRTARPPRGRCAPRRRSRSSGHRRARWLRSRSRSSGSSSAISAVGALTSAPRARRSRRSPRGGRREDDLGAHAVRLRLVQLEPRRGAEEARSRSRRLARPVPGAARRRSCRRRCRRPTTRIAGRRRSRARRPRCGRRCSLGSMPWRTAFSTSVSSAIGGKRSARRGRPATSIAKSQPVGHAHLHQLEVGAHQRELVGRASASPVVQPRHRGAQVGDQALQHRRGLRRARLDQRLHVGQRVEQEVRLDLRLQQLQPRIERLLLERAASRARSRARRRAPARRARGTARRARAAGR